MAKYITPTPFIPNIHGFHFSNRFDNVVFDNWLGSWTTHGRCGGMAYAALDYFYSGIPIPTHMAEDFPNGKVPDDNSILGSYIYKRLFDSFISDGLKFVSWTEKLDHYTWIYGEGVPQLTRNEEFPKLCQSLSKGPVALGLITTKSSLFKLGENHQVVAYGAELDDATGMMKVYTYNNNLPDEEVILTCGPSDLHFTGSHVYLDGSQDEYRGFFVMNYTPLTPPYVDLIVAKDISPGTLFARLGDPLEIKYTVKNAGQFPARLSSLSLIVKGPAGENLEPQFGRDFNSNPLPPNEERQYVKSCANFGTSLGDYRLKPVYYNSAGLLIDNLPNAEETKLTVNLLAAQILANPPYVERVAVVKAVAGLSPTGFGQINYGVCKYDATWEYASPDKRTLYLAIPPAPIIATRQLYIFIRVNTSNYLGDPAVPGTMTQLTLKLTGQASNGSQINIPVDLIQVREQYGGVYYWGSFKLENSWQTNYRLNMEITGCDSVTHFSKRSPMGVVLDSNPATISRVDQNTPPLFPFQNYEPGPDKNHIIDIAPIPQTLPADALEINNDYTNATKKALGMPDPINGAILDIPGLTLHNETDMDYFRIDFQSLAGDDTYSVEDPVTIAISEPLGLYSTQYPPRLIVYTYNSDDNYTGIDVVAPDSGARALINRSVGYKAVCINNPEKKIGAKQFYLIVKNPDFKTQGPFRYGLLVRYLPQQTVFSSKGAKLSVPKEDLRRRFLEKLFNALDLPRPGDDLTRVFPERGSMYDNALNVAIINDFQAFSTKFNQFFQSSQTIGDLKRISAIDSPEIVKQGMVNLENILKLNVINPKIRIIKQVDPKIIRP